MPHTESYVTYMYYTPEWMKCDLRQSLFISFLCTENEKKDVSFDLKHIRKYKRNENSCASFVE